MAFVDIALRNQIKKILALFTVDNDIIISKYKIRTENADYRRYYHIPLAASNPGASGATWIDASANTVGGWRLSNASHILHGQTDVHTDWSGDSDLNFEVKFCVNVDNTGGADTDTVDIKIAFFYKGIGETTCKTQTVEVATTVGKSARYKLFEADFVINWDLTSHVVEAGDVIGFKLNLETDTSEVDDIIITDMSFAYNTKHTYIEDGDT